MKSSSSSSPSRRILVALFTALIISLLLIGLYTDDHNNALLLPHRKLLQLQNDAGQVIGGNETERGLEPNRVWSDKCSKSDIVISQGPTEPLPNGIPTYTVEMINVCISGCDISDIHLTCGWFSSARLINPRVFKRLGFNDCLVNNGTSLAFGRTLSFRYANTFPYSFSVSSLRC